jgi:undecaprenyl-diphosphatase
MNVFDTSLLQFFSSLSHRCEMCDDLIVWLFWNNFVKGGMMMALFWWAWTQRDSARSQRREYLLVGFGLSIVALAVARALALSLPFRERPLRNPFIHFQVPYGMDPTTLEGWSSFPSDHAVVFFGMAATLWLVSRRLGITAAIYALVVIGLPRIYTGVHYPTDVIGGAALGWGMASLAQIGSLRAFLGQPAMRLMAKRPGPFHGLLFLATLELTELFGTVRVVLHPVTKLIRPVLQGLL